MISVYCVSFDRVIVSQKGLKEIIDASFLLGYQQAEEPRSSMTIPPVDIDDTIHKDANILFFSLYMIVGRK